MQHFILAPDGEPTPVDMMTWAQWFERTRRGGSGNWIVDKVQVGDGEVSTVFLGLDHNFTGEGDPLVFETMIFGGPWSEYTWRYTLRTDAQAGHDAIVAALREGRDPTEG